MKTMLKTGGAVVCLTALLLMVHSCGKSSSGDAAAVGDISSNGTGTNNNGAIATAPTAVTMRADFTTFGAPGLFRAAYAPAKLTSCPGAMTAMDGPGVVAGLDCDGDGGITTFVTPQSFKVALKRLSFVRADGDRVDFVPDQGTLAHSLVYDLSSEVTISQMAIPAGTYASVQAEIYYYEIRMPINSSPTVTQSIRVYLSDDDFPGEGGLGHHQGDITFIDADGNEMGWAGVGTPWTVDALQTDKALISRPGGTDSETGHQRGLFGNAELWDQAAFMQGDGSDVFLISRPLGLTVSVDLTKTVTFTFNVKDTWFYEDFDGNGSFNPCENGANDACAQNAEWAPIFNLPVLSIQ